MPQSWKFPCWLTGPLRQASTFLSVAESTACSLDRLPLFRKPNLLILQTPGIRGEEATRRLRGAYHEEGEVGQECDDDDVEQLASRESDGQEGVYHHKDDGAGQHRVRHQEW